MIEELSRGRVKGRKAHQCFDCYRTIPKGQEHDFATLKYDHIYTLRWHDDCRKAAEFYLNFHGMKFGDFDDGFPPLARMDRLKAGSSSKRRGVVTRPLIMAASPTHSGLSPPFAFQRKATLKRTP